MTERLSEKPEHKNLECSGLTEPSIVRGTAVEMAQPCPP